MWFPGDTILYKRHTMRHSSYKYHTEELKSSYNHQNNIMHSYQISYKHYTIIMLTWWNHHTIIIQSPYYIRETSHMLKSSYNHNTHIIDTYKYSKIIIKHHKIIIQTSDSIQQNPNKKLRVFQPHSPHKDFRKCATKELTFSVCRPPSSK